MSTEHTMKYNSQSLFDLGHQKQQKQIYSTLKRIEKSQRTENRIAVINDLAGCKNQHYGLTYKSYICYKTR